MAHLLFIHMSHMSHMSHIRDLRFIMSLPSVLFQLSWVTLKHNWRSLSSEGLAGSVRVRISVPSFYKSKTKRNVPTEFRLIPTLSILDGFSSHISRNNELMQIQSNASRYRVGRRFPQWMNKNEGCRLQIYSWCHTKRSMARPRPPIPLLVWQRQRSWGTF